jgi:hypothetical protein
MPRRVALPTHCFPIPWIEANVVEEEVEFQAARQITHLGQCKTDLIQAPILVIFIWDSSVAP